MLCSVLAYLRKISGMQTLSRGSVCVSRRPPKCMAAFNLCSAKRTYFSNGEAYFILNDVPYLRLVLQDILKIVSHLLSLNPSS
jgi:hypothetical protein